MTTSYNTEPVTTSRELDYGRYVTDPTATPTLEMVRRSGMRVLQMLNNYTNYVTGEPYASHEEVTDGATS